MLANAGAGDATAPALPRVRTTEPVGSLAGWRFSIVLVRHRTSRSVVRCGRAHPAPVRTEAIVLSRFDLGEADRVLTLITPGGGKLKAIAKGIRRPTSRLGGSLEPFAELTVVMARGPDVRRRHPGQRRARLAAASGFARVGGDRLVSRGAGGPLARGASRGRAALRAAAAGVRAPGRRDGAGPGRTLVRDAPGG